MRLPIRSILVLFIALTIAAGCNDGDAERKAAEQKARQERAAVQAAEADRYEALSASLMGKWYARVGKPEDGFYADMTLDLKSGGNFSMMNQQRSVRLGGAGVQSNGTWDLTDDVVTLDWPARPDRPEAETIVLKATVDADGKATKLTHTDAGGAVFTREPLPKAGPLGDPSLPKPATRPSR